MGKRKVSSEQPPLSSIFLPVLPFFSFWPQQLCLCWVLYSPDKHLLGQGSWIWGVGVLSVVFLRLLCTFPPPSFTYIIQEWVTQAGTRNLRGGQGQGRWSGRPGPKKSWPCSGRDKSGSHVSEYMFTHTVSLQPLASLSL